MRDDELPPLSATIGHFRSEVGRRAERLARRRRWTVGGSAAVVVVAVVAAVSALLTAPTAVHRSASSPGSTTTVTTGSPSAAGRYGPSGANGDAAAPGNAGSASPTTVPPTGPPWSLAGATRIADPPDGSTLRVTVGTPIILDLAAPSAGGWGGARIEQGLGSVVVPGGQSGDATGDTRVFLKAVGVGTARIEVPDLADAAGSWHGSIRVSAPASPHRSPG